MEINQKIHKKERLKMREKLAIQIIYFKLLLIQTFNKTEIIIKIIIYKIKILIMKTL